MNVKYLVIGILASISLLVGVGYAGYWYGQKKAAEEIVGFFSMACMRGALVETPDGQHFMCMPAKVGQQEKKKLDNFNEV
jgi:hypothetical protein